MYDILTLNKIAKCGTDAFDKANIQLPMLWKIPTLSWYVPQLCTICSSAISFSLSQEQAQA